MSGLQSDSRHSSVRACRALRAFHAEKRRRILGTAPCIWIKAHIRTTLTHGRHALPAAGGTQGQGFKLFVAYVENAMRLLGVSEINISVKTGNRRKDSSGFWVIACGDVNQIRSRKCVARNRRTRSAIGQAAMSNAELAREWPGSRAINWPGRKIAPQSRIPDGKIIDRNCIGRRQCRPAESQWQFIAIFSPRWKRAWSGTPANSTLRTQERVAGEAEAMSRRLSWRAESNQRALGRLGVTRIGQIPGIDPGYQSGLARDTAGA